MTTPRVISILNGLVFDGATDNLGEHPIHIRDGKIVGNEGPPEPGAEVLDANRCVISPGLIDAHFHAFGAALDLLKLEAMPSSYVTAHALRRLRRALNRGFTTIRDVAGGDLGIVRALEEELFDGPRYLFTGRALTQTGGHADPRPGDLDLSCGAGHMGEVVDGVDDLRRTVRERFRTGAHAIKIFTSGGVISPSDPLRLCQYSTDEIRAVVDEAVRRDSYVAAHAYSPEAIRHAIDNGVRSIEHGNLIDAETARAMADAKAFLVPTLIAYGAMEQRGAELGLSRVGQAKNREVLEAGVGSLAIALDAGVPIGFGTDLMGDLETEQLHEFRLRLEASSPLEVLRSATSINAELIRRPELGSLEIGSPADLVVFSGNPFEKPEVLWDERRTVIRQGRKVAA